MTTRLIFALALLAATPAHAWNGLGHKVVADIAWQTLDAPTRAKIVDTLRRHPRYDDDFARKMPSVDDDARWTFQHAATWPDIARGKKGYDHPTWHYVDFPIFLGDERPVPFNMATDPAAHPARQWNVAQAFEYCRAKLDSDAAPREKALAYCWMFHLVGDIHQPLHSTALVCDRFPEGDQGGNKVLVVQGRKLHSLWDGLLGRQDRMQDVAREVAELKADRGLWMVDTRPDFSAWVQESHEFARSEVYKPEILDAVQQPGELAKINLSEAYLQNAGDVARQRIVAAGLRLGVLLGGNPKAVGVSIPAVATPTAKPVARPTFTPSYLAPPKTAAKATPALTHWLNTETNVRHNSGCRFYGKTKDGRACTASDGKPCGICGG